MVQIHPAVRVEALRMPRPPPGGDQTSVGTTGISVLLFSGVAATCLGDDFGILGNPRGWHVLERCGSKHSLGGCLDGAI